MLQDHYFSHHICANTVCGSPLCRKTSLISKPETNPSLSMSACKNSFSAIIWSSIETTHCCMLVCKCKAQFLITRKCYGNVISLWIRVQEINTFTTSNPVKFFAAVVFGKGGIGGGFDDGDAVATTFIGIGDLALGIISFLLPSGINSGGSTFGIAYFSNALYTRCIAYIQ